MPEKPGRRALPPGKLASSVAHESPCRQQYGHLPLSAPSDFDKCYGEVHERVNEEPRACWQPHGCAFRTLSTQPSRAAVRLRRRSWRRRGKSAR